MAAQLGGGGGGGGGGGSGTVRQMRPDPCVGIGCEAGSRQQQGALRQPLCRCQWLRSCRWRRRRLG